MANYGLKRNAEGYKDETAYYGIMQAPKSGEVWRHTQNNGIEKDILVIKNHGTFCTTLLLGDTEHPESFQIRIDGKCKYTDPRMVQYSYNSNFGKYHCTLAEDVFNCIVEQIKEAIFPEMECEKPVESKQENTPTIIIKKETEKEQLNVGYETMVIDELRAVFGGEAVKTYCRLSAYKCKFFDSDFEKGDFYIDMLTKQ